VRNPFLFAAGVLLTLTIAGPATAHDTWFQPVPGPGAPQLALGTGNQFPIQEVPVGAASLVESGCRGRDGRVAPLRVLRETATALRLRPPEAGALTCWGQQASFEVELPADKVALYLREINAPAWARGEWVRLQAAGLPWKERYAKHARIELRGASGPGQPAAMAMDVLLDERAPRVGQSLGFQVLRDGQPLPGQAVELRGDMSPLAIWHRTDAEGRARIDVPWPGRWVRRGTDLRRSDSVPDQFESRFFNLAFEVRPREPALRPAAAGG
jgi:hypothetical protein